MTETRDLPYLRGDSTVCFDSYKQFQRHHTGHLQHGGILVQTDPLDVGTRRSLSLTIPDLGVAHEVDAFVVYRSTDMVGFVIEHFDEHRPVLRALAEQ